MKSALLLLPLLLIGCHSGTTRLVDVTVTDDVGAAYTAASPGLLVAELGGTIAWYVALCDQGTEDPITLSYDINYSCLGETGGPSQGDEEAVRVWVEPLPAGWDAAAVCAAQEVARFYRPRSAQVGEGIAELAPEPAPGWPQAEATGTWKRDLSPCGGILRTELTLG